MSRGGGSFSMATSGDGPRMALALWATALVARTGNSFAWLGYPIAIALVTVVVGSRYVTESSARKLWAEVA